MAPPIGLNLRGPGERFNLQIGPQTGGELSPENQALLDQFIAQQEAELAAFEESNALTPQQETNVQSQTDIAQAQLDAELTGATSAEAAAAQQQQLRDFGVEQITGAPANTVGIPGGETVGAQLPAGPSAAALPVPAAETELPPPTAAPELPAAQDPAALGLDFAAIREKVEADTLARRGLITGQRDFIEGILAEQENLTEGQKALISRAANNAISLGRGDIQTGLRDNLEILREELAPARGLRSTDSPIIDRGSKLALDSLRLEERLASNIRGAESAALIDLPRVQREFQLSTSKQLAELIATESGLDIDSATKIAELIKQQEELRLTGQELGGTQALDISKFSENQRQFGAELGLEFDTLGEDRRQFDLGLGLDRDLLTEEQLQFQLDFGQSLADFQEKLKTNAFNRRITETGVVGNLGLGLSAFGPSGVGFNVGTESKATATGEGSGLGVLEQLAANAGGGLGALIGG